MNNKEFEEPKDLPLELGYSFLQERNLGKEANEIQLSKDKWKSYTSTLRRGKVLNLLEKNNLFDDFLNKCWANGRTDDGKKRLRKYKRVFDSFSSSGRQEEEEEQEGIEESSFAYEEDLRDFLSNNLSIIEPGMRLYRDGVEFPVDNKRIDILGIDKNNVPVVIELKVSRGYEKVTGQCLLYRRRVKKILNVEKVRIVIIAKEITPELRDATEEIRDAELFEYKLSFKLTKIAKV